MLSNIEHTNTDDQVVIDTQGPTSQVATNGQDALSQPCKATQFQYQKEIMKISDNIMDLDGVGLELLIKDEVVLCRFFNGNILSDYIKSGNKEITETF